MDRRMLPQPEPIQVSLGGPEWVPHLSQPEEGTEYQLCTTYEGHDLYVFRNDPTGCWQFLMCAAGGDEPVMLAWGETAKDACRWAEREAERRAERLGLGKPSREEFKRRVFEDLAGLEQLAESATSIFGE